MNAGIIASRYASALMGFADECGNAGLVYEQARVILSSFRRLPQLADIMSNPHRTPFDRRLELLRCSVAPGVLAAELESFYSLMERNGRSSMFRMALLDFLDAYRIRHGLTMVKITSVDHDPRLSQLVTDMVKRMYGRKAVIMEKTDPDLIGGFILESWGFRLDCSVRASLERMRRELTRKTKRLV